jgi:hypothetical protein
MKVNMINLSGPRWSIVQQVQQQWSCFDQSPGGIFLVVELDYLPDSEVCFSYSWTSFPNGGVGGISPPQIVSKGVQGGGSLEEKFWEKVPCKIL